MYIHSTDSSCEKTKQEKQKNFSILLLKKQKKTLKKRKLPDEKNYPTALWNKKKRKFDFDIMCHQFLHAFCLFCHVLPHTTTTIYYSENKQKTLVNYYVFLSFFFSSFRNFSYVLGKIAGKCWQWKETKSFPFLNSPLPMFHVNCEWWCWMDEIKFFFDT